MNRCQSAVFSGSPCCSFAVSARAAAMRAAGKDIVGLGAGEPDFDTPEHIKQAAIKDGMRLLRDDGMRLVLDGTTSLDEMQRIFAAKAST